MSAEWVSHAIWWQIYPLGFVGASREQRSESSSRGLRSVIDWLDYAVELGASGIALGPIFSAETHGYDTVDYFAIDPRLGSLDDFDELVAAAHARGLRVLLDGVFNHVGRTFGAFRAAVTGGPEAPTASWFRLTWPTGWSVGDPEPPAANFEGHDSLVALNHESPAVVDLVTRVMNHWLERGADGWRLDAAYAVPPEFWSNVLPRVRADHPDVYVVGEVIHGDYADIVQRSGMDAVTQYELWKATWSAINDGNLFELAWAMKRHNEFNETFAPLTFVGNHDVTRIATRMTDQRHLAHALVVLFTVAGTPSVYYGDEQAFQGVKEDRAGGDDAIRPAFPADRDGLRAAGWTTFRLHQELIGLRRRHPWLHRSVSTELQLTNTLLVYESASDGDRIVVALNLADTSVRISGVPGEVLAGALEEAPAGAIVVPAHGWAVLGG